MRADLFAAHVAGHGEGPVWWPSEGLRLCDGYAGRLVALDDDGAVTGTTEIGSFVGAFRPRVGGGLVAAAERSFVLVDPDGTRTDLGELWSDPGLRMNDGACDPLGSFLCGSMPRGGDRPDGVLYRLHPDGTIDEVLTGLTVPNGLVFTPDGRTAYHIDTPTRRIDVVDVAADGTWHDRRPAVPHVTGGWPDGMTMDAEGNLWVALWGGAGVRCYDPATGAVLEAVEVDGATQTSACCFGGPDLDRLYITTSTESGGGGPLAGSVFVVEPGVRGRLPEPFAG